MKSLLSRIQFTIHERVYLKDPNSTELGRKIIQNSIVLIDELGLEHFTFRKLADKIGSSEASVYRYFENKHKLLIYLVSWYWNWIEYQLTFATNNIPSPQERLKIALRILSQPVREDPDFSHVNEVLLHRIVVAESAKAYLTKEVDLDNKEGYFGSYKRLCALICEILKEINPTYPYPTALISTAIESAHAQQYFSDHIPSLTEVTNDGENGLTAFLIDLVFKAIA